ncbi:unnamed protein product [Mycena citricolor]|uniref:Uncharacterized protein n=1 Tax=Mycena citricolor TaxID=2018698 RepID=A0AAD2H943_9AGAR|nr:unnamed protein product [Mycena citricolor]
MSQPDVTMSDQPYEKPYEKATRYTVLSVAPNKKAAAPGPERQALDDALHDQNYYKQIAQDAHNRRREETEKLGKQLQTAKGALATHQAQVELLQAQVKEQQEHLNRRDTAHEMRAKTQEQLGTLLAQLAQSQSQAVEQAGIAHTEQIARDGEVNDLRGQMHEQEDENMRLRSELKTATRAKTQPGAVRRSGRINAKLFPQARATTIELPLDPISLTDSMTESKLSSTAPTSDLTNALANDPFVAALADKFNFDVEMTAKFLAAMQLVQAKGNTEIVVNKPEPKPRAKQGSNEKEAVEPKTRALINKAQAMMRGIVHEKFGTTQALDFAFHQAATVEQVDAYASDETATISAYQWDFNEGYQYSAWNDTVKTQLVNKAIKVDNEGMRYVQKGLINRKYLEIVLSEQLARYRLEWKRFQPQFDFQKQRHETKTEAIHRGKTTVALNRLVTKVVNSQHNKFDHRRSTVEATIALKEEDGSPDLATWKRMLELLAKLGPSGMSEEEETSATKQGTKVRMYKIKVCIWRAQDVADYMRMIDTQSEHFHALHNGNKPAPRVRTKEKGTRAAPKGLPKVLYSPEWLASLTPTQVTLLKVSKEIFKLFAAANNLSPLSGSSQDGSHTLIKLESLSEQERKTLVPTPHFHGLVRNAAGVFVVFNAHRRALLNIPARPLMPYVRPALFQTAWMTPQRVHLACSPQYPIYHGDLLGVLNISLRKLPLDESTQKWTLAPWVIRQWTGLEGLLVNFATELQNEVCLLQPPVNCGAMVHRPVSYGYTRSFETKSELVSAITVSQEAFVQLVAAIALHFLALDGLSNCIGWREHIMRRLNLPHRIMDSLEGVVDCVLQDPAGMIIDCTEQSTLEIDWFFLLLLNPTVSIHPPVYLFLGEGDSAVKRASHIEAFPSMHKIGLRVQDMVVTLAKLPPNPIAACEYVFVKTSMRINGVFPNPDYYAALKDTPRQFPAVEPHSQQREGASFSDFFARRQAQNQRKLAVESSEERQRRLSLETLVASGRTLTRRTTVYIWREIDGFWIRQHLPRSQAEDEWSLFATTQRIYDSFSNTWDICPPLDPKPARDSWDSDSDDEDDSDNPYDSFFTSTGDDSTNAAPTPNTSYSLYAGSDTQLPPDLPAEVVTALQNPCAALEHVDSYHDCSQETLALPGINVAAEHTVASVLKYRVGFVDNPGHHYPDSELLGVEHCCRYLGRTNAPDPPGRAARALLFALSTAKTLSDMPANLFDLAGAESSDVVWDNSGVIIDMQESIYQKAPWSTAYVLKPRDEQYNDRSALIFSAATVMEIVRRRTRTWPDLISALFDLGVPFHVTVESAAVPLAPHQPNLFQWRGLGVRPETYKPNPHDLNIYWDLLQRFLRSSRGRLALQAGGVVARLARLVIENAELELRSEDVDIETAEERIQLTDSSWFFHALTQDEHDLILGVYSLEISGSTSGRRLLAIKKNVFRGGLKRALSTVPG